MICPHPGVSLCLLSVQEREENMKTVEGLLKTGLIEVANKEEELQVRVCDPLSLAVLRGKAFRSRQD